MKIYLAAKWADQLKLRKIAENLKNLGYDITSRWLWHHGKGTNVSRQQSAIQDIEDVLAADVLVSFTETPAAGYMTGGRHVEFGVAYQAGKKLLLVGPKENIFHYLPGVIQLDDLDSLISHLKTTL